MHYHQINVFGINELNLKKSGFVGSSEILTFLNETVTEKIARELSGEFYKNSDVHRLDFSGRHVMVLDEINRRFVEVIGGADAVNAYEKAYKTKIDEVVSKYEEEKLELQREYGDNPTLLTLILKHNDESFSLMKDRIKNFYHPEYKTYPRIMDIPIDTQRDIIDKSYKNKLIYAYIGEIVDIIIEILFLSYNRNGIKISMVEVWENLQKSYFMGNTMYLRSMISVFRSHGMDNILRTLDAINDPYLKGAEIEN